jgi:nitrous oxide reductase accessory protein NosL
MNGGVAVFAAERDASALASEVGGRIVTWADVLRRKAS